MHFRLATFPTFALLVVSASSASAQTRAFTVSSSGNVAHYRAQEQLADLDLPNEAVGTTSGITGSVFLSSAGRFDATSKIVIDVTRLKSDRERRDDYVQEQLLETAQYPSVTLVPLNIKGLPASLPRSGTYPIEITANLTVKGVTRVTTWKGRATFAPNTVTGHVSTTITFDQFGLKKPNVMMVLSLEDEVVLDYDFTLASTAR